MQPGTAVDEAYQLATDFDLSPDDIKPRVTCGIHWELSSVIDLTIDGLPSWLEVANWLKEDFEKINDAGNETLCQAFGRGSKFRDKRHVLSVGSSAEWNQFGSLP